ncbi:MAG TPA: hypothetical protein VF006_24960 [Longimicrobium sp.]
MESRWPTVLAAGGVLMAGAVFRPPTPAPPPPQPAAEQTTTVTQTPRPATPPRVVSGAALLDEFLGDASAAAAPRPAPARGTTRGNPGTRADSGSARGRFRYRLDVLIATVPDPVDSHLDWAYDSYVEAIRRAYERAGYVTDRFWMPWGTVADTARIEGVPVREAWPGVMLFRKIDPDSLRADSTVRLHLLYFVGEVPTRGVHRPALLRALRERDSLLAATGRWTADDSLRRRVRIVGPAFSGSSFSLRTALEAWIPAATAVDVLSGSATNLENLAILQDSTEVPLAGDTVVRIAFSATVHPDDALLEALFWRVLQPMGIRREQVAILREGSTYGRNAVPSDSGGRAAGARCRFREGEEDDTRFLEVPFPMNISRLRSEYARRPSAPAPPQPGIPGASPPQPGVPVDLSDRARPLESPPVQSELTLPMLEAALTEIGHTLARHDVRAVGVLASDVRDKLFLATEVRKRVTDAQVFTFEGNSLFLAPEHNRTLRGSLVVSTYPLFLQSQWLQLPPGERHRLPFTNEGAQGVHNAVLLHLDRPDLLAEYAGELAGGGWVPRVWITAVGSRSFLPLAAAAPTQCGYVRPAAAVGAAGPGGGRARPEFFTVAAVSLVALLMAGLCLLAGKDARASVQERRPVVEHVASVVRCESLRLHGHLYRALRIVALGGVFGPPALLVRRSLEVAAFPAAPLVRWGTWLLLAAAWVVLFLELAAALRIVWTARLDGWAYAFGRHWRGRRGQRWLWHLEIAGRAGVLVLGGGFLFLTMRFYQKVRDMPDAEFVLYLHRVAQLDGGVSPILPLIVGGIGFAAWCTWHLARIHQLRELTAFEAACLSQVDARVEDALSGRPAAAAREEQPWQSRGLSTLSYPVVKAVNDARNRLFLMVADWQGMLLIAVILGLAWILMVHFRPPLEMVAGTAVFDLLLRLLMVGSLVATAWAVYRLLAVWRALQRCLVEVGTTPLVTAFERLPAHVSQLTRLTLIDAPSCQILSSMTAAQLRHLERLTAYARNDLERLDLLDKKKELPAAVTTFRGFGATFRTGRRPCEEVDDVARPYLALDAVLQQFWADEPETPQIHALADEVKKGGATVPDTGMIIRRSYPDRLRLWLRAAEEFAAVQVVDYVEWVLEQMRKLALFLFVSLLLTTVLLSCYPFEPQSIVKAVFALILLGTVGALLYVMTDMNRNEILSRIAKTDPGRVTWDRTFIVNAVLMGIVPLLALISSEVPQLRNVLFFWITPLLRTIVGG